MTLVFDAPPADPTKDQTLDLNEPSTSVSIGKGLEIVPGLCLSSVVAAAAFAASQLPGMATFSPMILAILMGIGFHNIIGTPAWAKPGVTFSLRRLLRIAIMLLGLQLTATQIIEVGGRGLGIIATNTVTDAHDEDVAYAVACVTVFGSIAMFAYPLFPGLLHLDPRAFGLWTGASIHEIAQVVAAAFQDGQNAGEFATVAKLSRVMLLAPMVMALGLTASREARQGGAGGAAAP